MLPHQDTTLGAIRTLVQSTIDKTNMDPHRTCPYDEYRIVHFCGRSPPLTQPCVGPSPTGSLDYNFQCKRCEVLVPRLEELPAPKDWDAKISESLFGPAR